jgi:hypothetical protein
VLAKHQVREAAHHNPPPQWLINWEVSSVVPFSVPTGADAPDQDNRPRLLVECFAEFFAVFLYVFCGVGASYVLSSAPFVSSELTRCTLGPPSSSRRRPSSLATARSSRSDSRTE